MASQISIGCENDFKIRIHGTKGSIWWRQEYPNDLMVQMLGEPSKLLRRGNDYLCEASLKASRIPPGHPEAFLEAFANVYLGAAEAMRAKKDGSSLSAIEGDYPTVYDGARGIHFIEKTVESSASDAKWTDAKWSKPS